MASAPLWGIRTPVEDLPGEKERILQLFSEGMNFLLLDKPMWSDRHLQNFIMQFDMDIRRKIALFPSNNSLSELLWGSVATNLDDFHGPKTKKGRMLHCRNEATLLRHFAKVDFCIIPEALKEELYQMPDYITRKTFILSSYLPDEVNSTKKIMNVIYYGANVYDLVFALRRS